ncbi:MAG: dephospho-CoA kinase [Bacteroidales bacterium]|nr:dephospho-CoA kinase [Bacteroidales bacterium]
MKTILITGPIGGGKSQVCRILQAKGYPVYDSDSRTKELYRSRKGLTELLEKELGVKMENLGIIFTDSDKRERLEKIVYPLVREDFENFRAAQKGCTAVFLESATAWNKPQFSGCFDSVWLVDAPFETRAGRNPKALQRNSVQNFDGLEADITIINDSSVEELQRKIETILWKKQI